MREVWKDIASTGGRYQISNLGNVRRMPYDYVDTYCSGRHRHKSLQEIKCTVGKNGYVMFDTHYNKKRVRLYVHREVARAFIPNPTNLPCVNHIDENRVNNVVTNLEWCDYFYNNVYGTNRKRAVTTRRLNGTLVSKPYSNEELAVVLDNSLTSSEVADLLGRSKHAIESKRSRLRGQLNEKQSEQRRHRSH